MPKPEKLGRNPLARTKSQSPRHKPVHHPVEAKPIAGREMSSLDRLKDLEIQIDWKEFFETAVEPKIRRITRLFS